MVNSLIKKGFLTLIPFTFEARYFFVGGCLVHYRMVNGIVNGIDNPALEVVKQNVSIHLKFLRFKC